MSDFIHKFCLRDDESLRKSLEIIDRGGAGIALIVDPSERLIGTLTDGDIRRALLKGASLDQAALFFAQKEFSTVSPQASRAEVLDIMQARILHQLPVVDENFKLVGLHLLHQLLGAVSRPNFAVIMAGGRGTRLGELTESIPKPMLKVAGRPILERLIHHIVGYGIRRVFISTHYLGHVIEDHFGDGARFGCQIQYLRETEPLGTGGSLRLLPEKVEHPLIVCNGDLVTQIDLHGLLAYHNEHQFLATMGVRSYSHQIPFGCVEAEEGIIKRLEEKPTIAQLINAGIYVLSPSLLTRIPKGFYPITRLFEDCLSSQEKLGAFEVLDDWIDVGQREQLKQAREG